MFMLCQSVPLDVVPTLKWFEFVSEAAECLEILTGYCICIL